MVAEDAEMDHDWKEPRAEFKTLMHGSETMESKQ